MEKNKIRFIDLFAGIGGMRLAFEKNGCECVFGSEWDVKARETYKANFNEDIDGDITKIDESKVPDHEILLAGFPCQPFSSIGKREGFKHLTQGTLFFDIVRIIKEKKPKCFLLENVAGLKSHDGGKTFRLILKTLRNELGYIVQYKKLDAADYGVPQHRRRIFIVGFRKDLLEGRRVKFKWPIKSRKTVTIGKFVERNVKGHCIKKSYQKSYIFKIDDNNPQIIDRKSDFPVKTLLATYGKLQRLTGTFVRDGETGLRKLTVNECKAIMGFPKLFKIPVRNTNMYKQMGNSVAVPLVAKIARQMVITLKKVDKKTKKQVESNCGSEVFSLVD